MPAWRPVGVRFMEKFTEDESGCWLWQGTINRDGYGEMGIDRRMIGAHRIAYELFVGPIPEHLEIDHICEVRNCVNPEHLRTVTHRFNSLRGEGPIQRNARKTSCIHGHPFDEENTYTRPDGGRDCRICQRTRVREYLARKKAA